MVDYRYRRCLSAPIELRLRLKAGRSLRLVMITGRSVHYLNTVLVLLEYLISTVGIVTIYRFTTILKYLT